MTREHRTVFNLVQFDRAYLEPASTHFGRTRSKYWRTLRFCELLSGYFWLQLGIEAGYFPRRESSSVVGQRFGAFFGHFKEIFTSYGYMFPEPFESIISQALREPFANDSGLDRINSDPATLGAFGSALNLELCLVGNYTGEALIGVLNFAPDLISEVMTLRHSIQIGSEQALDQGVLHRGFAAVAEYMENSVRLSRTIIADPSIAPAQRSGLERRLRQITRWRVNRFRADCEEQFLLIGKSIGDSADLEFDQVRLRLVTLLNGWGFTHTKRSLGAGAR